jgi:hypothetical protein
VTASPGLSQSAPHLDHRERQHQHQQANQGLVGDRAEYTILCPVSCAGSIRSSVGLRIKCRLDTAINIACSELTIRGSTDMRPCQDPTSDTQRGHRKAALAAGFISDDWRQHDCGQPWAQESSDDSGISSKLLIDALAARTATSQ